MTTAATSLLGLALPVTGELAGTWGDTVNNSITSLLDSAVAGTTTLSTDGDVTLTTTTLAANQARQAILLCSGARTALRTITAPAQSKIYTIINATTGGFSVKLVGVGPTTGVTIVAGESALVAWNGSDFIKISNTGGAASFTNVTVSGTTTLSGLTASTALALNASKEVVSVTNTGTGNNVLSASPTLTGTVAGASLQLSSLTATRVIYAGTSGLLQDSTNLTFDGTSLTLGGNPTLSAGTANGVLYLNGSKVATAGSALTFDGTNLGIGTSSPGVKLDVQGSSPFARVKENTTGYMGFRGQNDSGNFYFGIDGSTGNFYGSAYARVLYSDGAYPMVFYTNATERMRLDSSGNLGIGTSSPSTKLHVAGAGLFAGGASNSLGVTSTAGSALLNLNTTGTGGRQFYIYASDNTNGVGGGKLTFEDATSGNRLVFDGASGNLGIGTSSPGVKLDVSGAIRSNSQVRVQLNGSNSIAAGAYMAVLDTAGTYGAITQLDASNNLSFWLNPGGTWARYMTLDTSGNLGLGVTPSAWRTGYSDKVFQLGARAVLMSDSNVTTDLGNNWYLVGSSYTYLATDAASRYQQYQGVHKWFNAPSGTAGNAITFTQAMTLDASGNLGLGGTSTSGGRLVISQNNATQPAIYLPTDESTIQGPGANTQIRMGGNLVLQSGNLTAINAMSASGVIVFGTGSSASEVARIDSSGNLGLGVTPSAWISSWKVLEQSGVSLASSSVIGIVGQNWYINSSGTDIYRTTAAASIYKQTAGSHSWGIAPSGTAGNAITFTQAMTLDASGQLGIGTTSPGYKLTVAGTAGSAVLNLLETGVRSWGIRAGGAATNTFDIADFTAGATRLTIDSSGNLLVGATSQFGGADCKVQAKNGSSAQAVSFLWNATTTGDANFVAFGTEASITQRGSITYNRTAGLTAYNTTSDYRAKNISGPVIDSGTLIDSTPVYMGKMKGATQERPMFIAHETPAYAHTGEKDAVDADGNPVYQQMDASALIPVMWAELQSLRKRLADAGIA